MYLWIKAFHVVVFTSWFAGLFYLPRIFVNHAMATDPAEIARLKLMEGKLYRFVTPIAWLTIASGATLWYMMGAGIGGWIHVKAVLILVLYAYHHYCGMLVKRFAADQNIRNHVWYRFFNEIPVLILIAVAILVVVKPF